MCSNEFAFCARSSETESWISGVMLRESKLMISSFTERLPVGWGVGDERWRCACERAV